MVDIQSDAEPERLAQGRGGWLSIDGGVSLKMVSLESKRTVGGV